MYGLHNNINWPSFRTRNACFLDIGSCLPCWLVVADAPVISSSLMISYDPKLIYSALHKELHSPPPSPDKPRNKQARNKQARNKQARNKQPSNKQPINKQPRNKQPRNKQPRNKQPQM